MVWSVSLSDVEKKLDDTLKKGDFDAIVEQLTPKILTSCKTNALLKALEVSGAGIILILILVKEMFLQKKSNFRQGAPHLVLVQPIQTLHF